MKRLLKMVFAITLAVIALAPMPVQAQVFVDCDTGDSIQDALDVQADDAVASVEFVGTCNEFITIARDRVVIAGADGATVNGQIRIFGPSNVTLRDFTITGPGQGVLVWGGRTRIIRVNLVENFGFGVLGQDGATIRLNDSTVANNGGPHGVVLHGSSVILNGSHVYGHPDLGIAVLDNSSLRAQGGSVGDNLRGIFANTGSSITAVDTHITDNILDGINMKTNASSNLENVLITRNGGQGIDLGLGSAAEVQGGSITDNGENGLYVANHSIVRLTGTDVQGNTEHGISLINDSSAVIDGYASVPANLSGWAVYCDRIDSSLEVDDTSNVGRSRCFGWRRHSDD